MRQHYIVVVVDGGDGDGERRVMVREGLWLVAVAAVSHRSAMVLCIQWLKKLSQCLAVSYYLTCNIMTSGGITLKRIHLIVYYISL